MHVYVALNGLGCVIGESHPRAKRTDAEVEAMRRLHDEGMSYAAIGEKFELSKGGVAKICQYTRRAQTVEGFRRVPMPKARGG